MKKLLFFLMVLLSHSSFADLYKCTTATKTAYQDKPCQTTQTQSIVVQKPHKTRVHAVALNNNAVRIERDAHGKIKRSEKAKDDFKAINPCPANGKHTGPCPGYVIDHIKPLACGGADSPANMQWQTAAAGKAKDAWERDNCSSQAKPSAQNQLPASDTPSRPTSFPALNAGTQTVYIGRRGGHYVMSQSGKKRYLSHK